MLNFLVGISVGAFWGLILVARQKPKERCRWRFGDGDYLGLIRTDCNRCFDAYEAPIEHFVFCPFCGEKVKCDWGEKNET